ncbi:uncharacterized protein LOC128930128 [Callithrix jacchus]
MEWGTRVSGGGWGWRRPRAAPSPRRGVRGSTGPRAAATPTCGDRKAPSRNANCALSSDSLPASGGSNRNRNSVRLPPLSAVVRGRKGPAETLCLKACEGRGVPRHHSVERVVSASRRPTPADKGAAARGGVATGPYHPGRWSRRGGARASRGRARKARQPGDRRGGARATPSADRTSPRRRGRDTPHPAAPKLCRPSASLGGRDLPSPSPSAAEGPRRTQ